jgi:molybdate transport system ATP-binding protein
MLDAHIVKQLRDFSLDLSLKVENGQIMVLMGDNGAGKSTTLNILAGLLAPDSGSIRLNGSLVFDAGSGIEIPAEDRRVGYVFQRSTVFPHMTVRENIAFGLHARHCDAMTVQEQVAHWLKKLNIGDLAEVKAAQLSGGQKQRVALARALATDPALLMLDEPFTGLDVDSIRSVKDTIRKCASELQIPCLLVTHRVADARDIGDHACLMVQGKISWEGRASETPGCGCHP